MKIGNWKLNILRSRSGQSLAEVVIGLAIGAILMGTAAFAVTTMLRTNLTSEKSQFASRFAQSLSDNVRSFAAGNWDTLYNLVKGASAHYFLNASGTTFFVVQGEEGMLDGDVTDGLVGHWKFDEIETSTSTTTYDATGSGNNGTLTNGPTRATSTCKISNCISFDGVNDYVNIGDRYDVGTSNFSISVWMYLNNIASSSQIVGKGTWGYRSWGLWYRCSGCSSPRVARMELKVENPPGTLVAADSIQLSAGQWYHIVATVDRSGSVAVYTNGLLSSSSSLASISGYNLDNSASLWFGNGSPGPLNGYLDDVRIYNRALSADEVRQLYNSGIYERFFTVENVCRTNDASSTIAGTAPCSGSVEDTSTQWINAYTQWAGGATTNEVKLPAVITRSRNAVFRQTDWSGGAADEGAVAAPTSRFASSTNASTTGGVIQIQNLSQQ